MIELTLDQVRALAQAGDHPTVIDPTTRMTYVLIPTDICADVGTSRGETTPPRETPVEPWKHLVLRRHPWRKQLSLKGRNRTVRHLVGGIRANTFTEEQAAENYDLPLEAIREALTYAEENAALLDLETAYERSQLARRGERRGPRSVP